MAVTNGLPDEALVVVVDFGDGWEVVNACGTMDDALYYLDHVYHCEPRRIMRFVPAEHPVVAERDCEEEDPWP